MLCIYLPLHFRGNSGLLLLFPVGMIFFTLYLYSFAVECPNLNPLNLANRTSSSNMIKSKRLSKQNKHWSNIYLQVWTSPGTWTEANTSIFIIPMSVNQHNSLAFSKHLPVYAGWRLRSQPATMAPGATRVLACRKKWTGIPPWLVPLCQINT